MDMQTYMIGIPVTLMILIIYGAIVARHRGMNDTTEFILCAMSASLTWPITWGFAALAAVGFGVYASCNWLFSTIAGGSK